MSEQLQLTGRLPDGRLVIEASAGTGKTYSLSALVVRHVAERGLAASSLLVVTFTRAAAAELRDRTRAALVAALQALDTGIPPKGHEWMSVLLEPEHEQSSRRGFVQQAIATFDDATIATIHGFCQLSLRQLGLRSGTALNAELGDSTARLIDEVCRDLVVATLVDDPAALDWSSKDAGPATVFSRLSEAVKALLGNPGAIAVPDPADVAPAKNDTIERLTRWVELVRTAADEVIRRRRARQELGYDDLITGLRDAVRDPVNGRAVVESLESRYQLVLVDEFQDTDPVQWQIFNGAFRGNLVLVGDPKQAIYRFRGADVHAYLAATNGVPTVQLGTNFRSDGELVAATNSLIDGMEFGDERIVGVAVAAAPTSTARALAPGRPFVVRRVPDDPSLRGKKGFSVPLGRRAVIADMVRLVVEMLDTHTINGERVRPGDIAVLVPSHSLAASVVSALERARVPAVRTRTGSVLQTPAAAQWALLLAALERPSHAPTVRAAGLSVFLRRPVGDLDPTSSGSEQHLAAIQQRCAQWAEQLSSRPFLAWYDQVRADSDLAATVLAAPGGERELTDIDHIAELLATDLLGMGTTAASARRSLDRLRAEGDESDDIGPQMRRIDSDAEAVQITTLHGSKGLQYPVVLLPFMWQATTSRGPLIYNDPESSRRVIDIATGQKWRHPTDQHQHPDARSHYAASERRNDSLRLLYVGITRAERRTVLWWAPGKDAPRSAVNALLFDRDELGQPLCSRDDLTFGAKGGVTPVPVRIANPTDVEAVQRLQVLAERSGGLIDVAECPPSTPPVVWDRSTDEATLPPLSVADPGGREIADDAWRRWSFTSITRTRDHVWVPSGSSAAPVVGGADEPEEPEGDDLSSPSPSPSVPVAGMPWADVLAGTAFGTLVHTVLERIDPAAPDRQHALAAEVGVQLRRDRLPVPPSVLVAGLAAALDTTLGPLADDLRLADIPATDRLVELDFDMPLGSVVPRVTASQIGGVLLATLPGDDPQRGYASDLAAGRFEVDLAGFLQGSIDAVLRVPDPEVGHRFIVVDYKTNRLHPRGAANPIDSYRPDRLPAAMADHDYPLQSILYSVALHRYLRWRLPAYDPSRHLGGIAYLFLRGMIGSETPLHEGHPYGVFSWRPPAATVVALDRLLATGAAS